MGEAQRRKAANNTAPKGNYRKRKKMTRKQEQEIAANIISTWMHMLRKERSDYNGARPAYNSQEMQ